MTLKKSLFSLVCGALALSTFTVHTAHAAFIPTHNAIAIQKDGVDQQRQELINLLNRDEIRAKLQSYGISADEAQVRVAGLSDEQVAQLQQQIDELPTGEGAVGAIIGALLIVFLVLLFTDIIGETDVYDFD